MAKGQRHCLIVFGLWAVLLMMPAHMCWAAAQAPIPALASPQNVKIAFLAFRGKQEAIRKWQPTAAYLSARIPTHTFDIVPLSLEDMEAAVRNEQVDFILTNPGNYVTHEAFHGVIRIATLRSSTYRSAGNRFGAVIFTHKDRKDIENLEDLKGKRFMAIHENAFGGFQLAWREMKAQGIDPFDDLAALEFVGFPHDKVIEAVLTGETDAGTIRAGILESLSDKGKLNLSELRILNPQNQTGFPYALSTGLYPEWPFAQLKHTSAELSHQVALALLGMPPDHPAAITGGYTGWTVPLDYQPVHEVFKELHVGPYGLPVEIRFSDLMEQYWQWAVFTVILMGIAVLWAVRVEHLVAKRTAELSQANTELETQIAERKRAEDVARQRQNELAHVSRVNTMGELTASLAHEINQPLSAISNFATGSVRRLKRNTMDTADLRDVLGSIASEAERAGEVIRRVRDLVRKGEVSLAPLNLNAIILEVVAITHAEAERQHITVQTQLDDTTTSVIADKVQIEQVLLNLVGNGMEALQGHHVSAPTITIVTALNTDGDLVCSVHDNGAGLSQTAQDLLFEPFYSTKPNGMGMGLSISRSIVEASGGRMWVDVDVPQGTMFKFSLPTKTENGAREVEGHAG